MTQDQPSPQAPQTSKDTRVFFWVMLILPTFINVVGFTFAYLLGATSSYTPNVVETLTPFWIFVLIVSGILAPLYCAVSIAARCSNTVTKIISVISVFLLIFIANAILGVITCAQFITPNFH